MIIIITGLNINKVTLFSQMHDIPDGHRAPVTEVLNRGSSTRSVDTQTPSGCIDLVDDTGSSGSRSQSISPATIPIIMGHMDSSRPSSNADSLGGTPREVERLERGMLTMYKQRTRHSSVM